MVGVIVAAIAAPAEIKFRSGEIAAINIKYPATTAATAIPWVVADEILYGGYRAFNRGNGYLRGDIRRIIAKPEAQGG